LTNLEKRLGRSASTFFGQAEGEERPKIVGYVFSRLFGDFIVGGEKKKKKEQKKE
jgi:hypothetical protein